MKKLLISSAFVLSALFADATPPASGGYVGHRIMFGGEFAYAPFYTSVPDFFTKFNFQYGGNLGVIVGRRAQVNVFYNAWSLGNNDIYEGNFVSGDRVKGAQYGLTWRQFRKKRGGLAPIGKYWDVSLSYAQNKFVAAANNPDVLADNAARLPKTSDQLMAHVSFGTQMVFWNHFYGNTGLRFGAPLLEINSEDGTSYKNFLYKRLVMKEIFSVYFGVGILI